MATMPHFEVDVPMPEGVQAPPRAIYRTAFALADEVGIDGDTSLRGFVTGLCWKAFDGHSVEVSWMHNGTSNCAWFQPWRLRLVDQP